MSDVAAPAAPVAAPNGTIPAPTNGAPKGSTQAPASGPPKPLVPTPAPKPGGRANNGQFLPKDGTVGVAGEGEHAQTPAAKVPEEWRFKDKLKVFGEEEDADLSRDEVKAKLQKLRALEKKHLAEFAANDEKARRVLGLLRTDPQAFLREAGHDPAQLARKLLAEEARQGAMTDDERALAERDAKIAELEGKENQRLEAEKKQAAAARHEKMVGGFKAKLTPAIAVLKAEGVPEDHDTLAALVETMKTALEPGLGLDDVTPEELARDTLRRMDTNAERYLGRLEVPALIKRLGPARIQAILEHSLAEFERSQDFGQSPRAAPPPVQPRQVEERIDESELNRRLNTLRRGGSR